MLAKTRKSDERIALLRKVWIWKMLVITRKENDSIVIETEGGLIEITVMELGRQARLGISAPKSCHIWRKELFTTIQENRQASAEAPNLMDVAKLLNSEKEE